jgi:hypothetical protein
MAMDSTLWAYSELLYDQHNGILTGERANSVYFRLFSHEQKLVETHTQTRTEIMKLFITFPPTKLLLFTAVSSYSDRFMN